MKQYKVLFETELEPVVKVHCDSRENTKKKF